MAAEVATDGAARLPVELEAGELTVLTGSVATVAVGSSLRLIVDGTMTIEQGAALDLSGKGFAGGNSSHPEGFAPELVSGSLPDAGGSHGGTGVVWSGAGPAGEVYDSVYLPLLSGGGGAKNDINSSSGTRGGGAIELDVGTLVLEGEIRVDAQSSSFNSRRPGGAGGSVLVRAGTLRGGGLIRASGASTRGDNNGNHHVGPGGGGRVALWADVLAGFDPLGQVLLRGGRRQQNSLIHGWAAPGTLLVADAGSVYGRLIVDSGEESDGTDRVGPASELPELGGGALASLLPEGTDARVTFGEPLRPRWRGAWMVLRDATGGELGTHRVLEVDELGRALLAGAGAVTGAASYHGEYRFDSIELLHGAGLRARDSVAAGAVATSGAARLPAELVADNLTIRAGSVTTVATGSTLRLAVSGTMTIEAGARLDVSGRGFAGGTASHPAGLAPELVSPSQPDAGGSHGGIGTVWNGGGAAGEVYDSVYVPQLAGAGGSEDNQGFDGTRGGGVVDLDVTELVLDGEIRANSQTSGFNSGRPAGAGGSVLIRAGVMSGGGSIHATGSGTGTNFCCDNNTPGSGGGGRVAIYADSLVGFDPAAQVQARGGTRGRLPAPYAAAGTVLVWDGGSTYGRLIVDNGSGRIGPATKLPALGIGGVLALEADGGDAWLTGEVAFLPRWLGTWMVLTDGFGVELGGFRVLMIDAAGRTLLEGAAGVVGAADFRGEYRFDSLDERNGSTVAASDPVIVGGT